MLSGKLLAPTTPAQGCDEENAKQALNDRILPWIRLVVVPAMDQACGCLQSFAAPPQEPGGCLKPRFFHEPFEMFVSPCHGLSNFPMKGSVSKDHDVIMDAIPACMAK